MPTREPIKNARVFLALALVWALASLVRRLSSPQFDEARAAGAAPSDEGAWTEDGYIKNQDCLSAHTYRTISADNNCCGPVAAFDLRRHEGQDARFPDVLAEMDAMHLLCVPGPTFMHVMRRYLRKYLPGWREIHGRGASLAAAERSRMGIIRYHEQRIPHFVPYYRLDGGTFRFFNVCDGAEDSAMTMAEFAGAHLLGGSVKLICWE